MSSQPSQQTDNTNETDPTKTTNPGKEQDLIENDAKKIKLDI